MILTGTPIYSQSRVEIEESLHASIMLKALTYDSKMESANITVISRKNGNSNRSALVKSVNGKFIKNNAITVNQITYSDKISLLKAFETMKPGIIYLCDDLHTSQILEISEACNNLKILTISGTPDFVRSGYVSMSVIDENQKPKIILSLKKLKSEGRNFQASLLKLCKIID